MPCSGKCEKRKEKGCTKARYLCYNRLQLLNLKGNSTMAKKSAASKGYRKQKKETPFITKKDLIILAVIAGVILLGVLAFNLFYDDGFVAPKEIQSGDIISRANTSVQDRYMKVGTINELEGYIMEASTSPETPTGGYYFTPETESSLKSLRVSGGIWSAEKMLPSVIASVQALGADEASEPIETTINGNPAFVCSAKFNQFNGDDENITSLQYIYCYVTAGEYSVSMTATVAGADPSVFIPDDQLADYMGQFAGVYTPVEVK